VFDKVTSTELLTAILLLFESVHSNCSALVLVELLGSLLCLHLKPTESNVTHYLRCHIARSDPSGRWGARGSQRAPRASRVEAGREPIAGAKMHGGASLLDGW
jgi:hypothetical protein